MEGLLNVESLVAFLTLTGLEIVLGIDNLIFIAILAGKLPPEQRDRARRLGIALAVVSRLALLFSITLVMRLTVPFFHIPLPDKLVDGVMVHQEHGVSGKDLILIFGGLFLLAKATYEIHHRVRHIADGETAGPARVTLRSVLVQIVLLDVVFSLDSVITAVGLTQQIAIMVAAVLVSVVIMLALSGTIVAFIDKHPALKILALAFLIMIGALLVAEGFHQSIGKGYVYFAMAFSVGVETLQILAESKKPALTETPTQE